MSLTIRALITPSGPAKHERPVGNWCTVQRIDRQGFGLNLPGRIVFDPEVCGGRAHFRGTRVPAYVVLEMLDNGENETGILEDFPSLTKQDLEDARVYRQTLARDRMVLQTLKSEEERPNNL